MPMEGMDQILRVHIRTVLWLSGFEESTTISARTDPVASGDRRDPMPGRQFMFGCRSGGRRETIRILSRTRLDLVVSMDDHH